jgi:aldehyde oxidoreductase
MTRRTVLNINGVSKNVYVDLDDSLARVPREQLGLTGTKVGYGLRALVQTLESS